LPFEGPPRLAVAPYSPPPKPRFSSRCSRRCLLPTYYFPGFTNLEKEVEQLLFPLNSFDPKDNFQRSLAALLRSCSLKANALSSRNLSWDHPCSFFLFTNGAPLVVCRAFLPEEHPSLRRNFGYHLPSLFSIDPCLKFADCASPLVFSPSYRNNGYFFRE